MLCVVYICIYISNIDYSVSFDLELACLLGAHWTQRSALREKKNASGAAALPRQFFSKSVKTSGGGIGIPQTHPRNSRNNVLCIRTGCKSASVAWDTKIYIPKFQSNATATAVPSASWHQSCDACGRTSSSWPRSGSRSSRAACACASSSSPSSPCGSARSGSESGSAAGRRPSGMQQWRASAVGRLNGYIYIYGRCAVLVGNVLFVTRLAFFAADEVRVLADKNRLLQ